jgi:protein TonB
MPDTDFSRDDWKGLGASLAAHAALLALFALFSAGSAAEDDPYETLGLVEVELGPLQAAEPAPRAEKPSPLPPKPQPSAEASDRPSPSAKPVEAPKVKPPPATETVAVPKTDRVDPQATTPGEALPALPRPDPSPTPAPPAGGTPTTNGQNTSATTTQGTAPRPAAPYSIEGLSRTPIATPLPSNPGAAGTVRVRVIVAPDGSVSQTIPLTRGGNAALDRAALNAVRAWRFAALPPAAPQEDQQGTVTFRFTLD